MMESHLGGKKERRKGIGFVEDCSMFLVVEVRVVGVAELRAWSSELHDLFWDESLALVDP
jgi:hypothetical protein